MAFDPCQVVWDNTDNAKERQMNYKRLKEVLETLDEKQLEEEVFLRDGEMTCLTLAVTEGGVPFFLSASEGE